MRTTLAISQTGYTLEIAVDHQLSAKNQHRLQRALADAATQIFTPLVEQICRAEDRRDFHHPPDSLVRV